MVLSATTTSWSMAHLYVSQHCTVGVCDTLCTLASEARKLPIFMGIGRYLIGYESQAMEDMTSLGTVLMLCAEYHISSF